jgi:hypothetical protein
MIKRIRYDGNEIIKTDDQNNNGDHGITNIDETAKFFGADMVITGLVVSEQTVPDMTVKVSAGIAEDDTDNNLLNSEAFTSVTIATADGVSSRRDTIEIRRATEDTTPELRQFKDPNTGSISQNSINTVREYKTEIKVLTGVPGSGVAISAEPGWIKIAEILVPAGSSSVVNANIYNVDAVVSGGTNTNWTNDQTAIYRNGSQSEVKTNIFTKGVPEHSLTVPYEEFTSFVQDEGMVWASILAANQGNKPSTNQDKWIPAYAPTKPSTVSATGTFTIEYRHHYITSDTSGGSNTITLQDGKFVGQKVTVECDGTGLTNLEFTGKIPTGPVPISDGKKCNLEWNSTAWVADGGVTADYVTSGIRTEITSLGKMKHSEDADVAGLSTYTPVFPVPFATNPIIDHTLFPAVLNRFATGALRSTTSTRFQFVRSDTGSAQSLGAGSRLTWKSEGDY